MLTKFIPAGLLALFLSTSCPGQDTLTNRNGDRILLYMDGTWEYLKDKRPEARDSIMGKFQKPGSSETLWKSERTEFGVWFNKEDWRYNTGITNPAEEKSFIALKGDLFGLAITENLNPGYHNIRDIVLQYARTQMPDMEVVRDEFIEVNGVKTLHIVYDGVVKGILFRSVLYIACVGETTIQLMVGSPFFGHARLKDKIYGFLNGLVFLGQK